MTQEEISTNNKLIVEFMGFPIKTNVTEQWYGYDYRSGYDSVIIYSNVQPVLLNDNKELPNLFDSDNQLEEFKYQSHLAYNKSWNELMPVVEKVESLDSHVEISTNTIKSLGYCRILHNKDYNSEIIKDGYSKIEATYKALIEFIIWHNKQN